MLRTVFTYAMMTGRNPSVNPNLFAGNVTRLSRFEKGSRRKVSSPPPRPEEVEAFVDDGQGGPSLDEPLFDWLKPFSSHWNSELLHALAVDFAPKLQDGPGITFNPKWRTTKYLKQSISRKLARTRQSYKDRLPPELESGITALDKELKIKKRDSNRVKQLRRVSRRSGVRKHYFPLQCQIDYFL